MKKPIHVPATTKLAPPSPRSGVALPLGAHPGNTGGKPGRSGRPPNEFKVFLAKMRKDPNVQDALENALKDHEGKNYGAALRVLTDYDDQKPAKKVELTEPMTNAQRAEAVRHILERERKGS